MLHLVIIIGFILFISLVFYKVAMAIVTHWQQVKGTLLLLLLLAISCTTFLLYIDEQPGFKDKMMQAGDWIMAGIYTCIFFMVFSGLYFLIRKKEA